VNDIGLAGGLLIVVAGEAFVDFSLILVCSRLGVPAACASASLMCDIFFIFIDPCAGRHLLSLLRQRR
jgi:hypothetical protein